MERERRDERLPDDQATRRLASAIFGSDFGLNANKKPPETPQMEETEGLKRKGVRRIVVDGKTMVARDANDVLKAADISGRSGGVIITPKGNGRIR